MRCQEAVEQLEAQYDVVVNIQGDEPLMEPSVIDETVQALLDAPGISYRCFCCLLRCLWLCTARHCVCRAVCLTCCLLGFTHVHAALCC